MLTGKTYLNTNDREYYRVISENEYETVLFQIKDEKSSATDFITYYPWVFKEYLDSKVYLSCEDPVKLINTQFLSENARKKMTRRFQMAQEIYDYNDHAYLNKSERQNILRMFSQKFCTSEITLRRLMSDYFRGNMCPVAVAPKSANQGGFGKPKKHQRKTGPKTALPGTMVWKHEEKFNEIYKKNYLATPKATIQGAYEKLLGTYFTDPLTSYRTPDAPSYRQFYNYVKKQDKYERDAAKFSRRAAEQNQRVLHSSEDADVTFPYQVVQIDATPLSINCVCTDNPDELVGRPHLYVAIDVYSRMILGYTVTYENNGYLSFVEYIVNIVEDKEEACRRDGFEIDPGSWDVKGIMPAEIDADRGESWTRNSNNITYIYGCKLENKPSYRGDLKGIVERLIGTIDNYIRANFPGAILKDHPDRGDYDSTRDACLDLQDVKEIVVNKIIEHNNRQIKKFRYSEEQLINKEIAVPRLLFENGLPKTVGIKRDIDPEILRWDIMKETECTIRKDKTIQFDKLSYSSTDPTIQSILRKLQGEKVRVMYTERDTNHARVIHEKSRADFIVDIFPKERTDLSRSEVKALREQKEANLEEYNRTEGHKAMVKNQEKITEIIDRGKNRFHGAPDKKHKRENRENEKMKMREAFNEEVEQTTQNTPQRSSIPNPRGWRKK